jgi:PAS domain S-box-containing protein
VHYIAILIACLSIFLQFIAALWSARLMRLSGRGIAWALISAAIALMTMRRAVALWGMLKSPTAAYLDLSETIGFFISLLMCLGVFRLGSYFRHSSTMEGSREGWKRLFGRLFERADEGKLLIDRGRIVDCNDKAAHILGYTERANIIGQRPDDISPQRQPDGQLSSEKAEAMMARALSKGNARFEWVHKSIDGTPVPMEVVLTKIEIEGTTLLHTSWRDLSETKRSELALRESLQTSEEFVQNVPSGILLFHYVPVTGSFALLDGNHEAERITGVSIAAWRGKDITAIFPDMVQRGLDAEYREVMLTGRAHTREDLAYKNRYLQMASRVHAFRLPGGRLAVTYDDIVELKRSEEALHALETQHRLLFETIPQGILLEDAGGRIVNVNPAAEQILGLNAAQLQGIPAMDPRSNSLRPDGTPFPRSEFPTVVALRTGVPVSDVVMSITNPLLGVHRRVIVGAVPLFRPGEEHPYQAYATINDITDVTFVQQENRRLREQLQEQSRSPDLGAVSSALKEMAASLPGELHSIRAVVDGLLLFTSVNSEELHVQSIDPATLIQLIIRDLHLPDSAREVEWTVDPMTLIETDPIMLKRVFRILIENAVKFSRTRPHAEVRVGCSGDGATRVYIVRDNGVGFDASRAGLLFGAFQRFHANQGFEGAGINLAIAHRTIRRLGGWLWAESTPERGATFYVYLPGT